MSIQPATSYQVLALLSADMDEAEQAAVWMLVSYLRAKEIEPASADLRFLVSPMLHSPFVT